jgi:hypothetical protein
MRRSDSLIDPDTTLQRLRALARQGHRQALNLDEEQELMDLTPAELSKEMVHKAEQVAPSLPSATEGKKARGEKRHYAAPKAEVAQAIGVGTATLVAAEQHVAAMERYPILGGPEVSQK